MAAPALETFTNGDNVSEDRSQYKAGRGNCERTNTLGINDKTPAASPARSKNKQQRFQFGSHYYDQGINDFSITVVS